MATLRFSFGTMGSGKSTMALQIHHNLASRDLYGLLLTTLDREGAQVTSRLGVAASAVEVVPDLDLYKLAVDHWPLHYLVCDEAQFYSADQCDQLGRVGRPVQQRVVGPGAHLGEGGRHGRKPCRNQRVGSSGRIGSAWPIQSRAPELSATR